MGPSGSTRSIPAKKKRETARGNSASEILVDPRDVAADRFLDFNFLNVRLALILTS